MERFLAGEDGGEIREHMESCAACREIRHVQSRLEDEGRTLRERDLSMGALRETRWRAAAVLEEGVKSGPVPRPSIWARWRFAGACAAGFVAVAGFLIYYAGRPYAGEDAVAAEFHMKIRNLEHRVERFKEREPAGRSAVERQIGDLRARIRQCSAQLGEELRGIAEIKRDT
jgi:hypothetical protein